MDPFCQLYAKNRIDKHSDNVGWYGDCREALAMLVGAGTHLDAQNAQTALMLLPPESQRAGRFEPQVVRMGGRIVCDGFTSTEVSFK